MPANHLDSSSFPCTLFVPWLLKGCAKQYPNIAQVLDSPTLQSFNTVDLCSPSPMSKKRRTGDLASEADSLSPPRGDESPHHLRSKLEAWWENSLPGWRQLPQPVVESSTASSVDVQPGVAMPSLVSSSSTTTSMPMPSTHVPDGPSSSTPTSVPVLSPRVRVRSTGSSSGTAAAQVDEWHLKPTKHGRCEQCGYALRRVSYC